MSMNKQQIADMKALHKTVGKDVLVRIRKLPPVLNGFFDDDRHWDLSWLFHIISRKGIKIHRVPKRSGSREMHRYISAADADSIGNNFTTNYAEWKGELVEQERINEKHEKAHEEFLADQSDRAKRWKHKRAVDRLENAMYRSIADRQAAVQSEQETAANTYRLDIDAAGRRCLANYEAEIKQINKDLAEDIAAIKEAAQEAIAALDD